MAKKKDAHHGGAWKVAYADFVTAMMALFIVLWICKEKPKLAALISATFEQPMTWKELFFGGFMEKPGQPDPLADVKMTQEEIDEILSKVTADIQKMINKDDPDNEDMEIQVTSDGVKILLFDNPKKPLFEPLTAKLTKWGEFVMESLSWIIEKYKMRVFIDAHVSSSDAQFPKKDYGLWELTVDRATACRRSLLNYACSPKAFFRVAGYGDSKPLPDTEPESEENDRIMFNLTIKTWK